MGTWTQRRRDAATLEERRLKGLALLRSGLSQAEVVRRLGVTPVAVRPWKKALDRGGPEALHAVLRSGRPPQVPRPDLVALPAILTQRAQTYRFSTDHWTIPCIVKVAGAR